MRWLCSLLILVPAVWADDTVFRDARTLGRGGTSSLDGDGPAAVFGNPAELRNANGMTYRYLELLAPTVTGSLSIPEILKDLTSKDLSSLISAFAKLKRRPLSVYASDHAGVYFNKLGISFIGSGSGRLRLYNDAADAGSEKISFKAYATTGVGAAYSYPIWEGLSIGAGLNYYPVRVQYITERSLADLADDIDFYGGPVTGSGFGINLGSLYRLAFGSHNLAFSLSIENVGNVKFSDEMEPLLQSVNLGFAYNTPLLTGSLGLYGSLKDALGKTDGSFLKRLHLGADFVHAGWVGLSTGLYQGYPTIGAFLNWSLLTLDLGVMSEELDDFVGTTADLQVYLRFVLRV